MLACGNMQKFRSEGFQVVTVASMKMTVFRDVAPCSLAQIHRRFRYVYSPIYLVERLYVTTFWKTVFFKVPFGRAMTRLVAGLSPRRPSFAFRSSHMGFMVDKVALGQIFSKFFGFPCQYDFTIALCILVYHLGDEQ
jgi:hypothetical protein